MSPEEVISDALNWLRAGPDPSDESGHDLAARALEALARLERELEETRDELRTLRPALEMSESELEEVRQERNALERLALTNARAADRNFDRIGELEAALREIADADMNGWAVGGCSAVARRVLQPGT